MSLQLISRSPDLVRLRNAGYEVDVRFNHLLVRNVPYVNSRREVRRGTLVSELTLAGGKTAAPGTHIALFIGDFPCHKDGSPIVQIHHESITKDLGNNLVVNHSFSNKPPSGYPDYFAKMSTYAQIISHPAAAIEPLATAKTFAPTPTSDEESVFKYADTASSRAGIAALTAKLAVGKVAVVGVGGTGSYILDLISKTPVKEIHLFDADRLLNHNAFRAPGAPSIEQLDEKPLKVGYYADIYGKMRRGIVAHAHFIDVGNADSLREMNFVFLCMDGGEEKRRLVERLREWNVSFIDVGMGVELNDAGLGGVLRVTTVTPKKNDHALVRIPRTGGGDDDGYSSNIQIADLNMLNATLAVMKWKKILGFYRDLDHEHYSTFTIDGNMLLNEDKV